MARRPILLSSAHVQPESESRLPDTTTHNADLAAGGLKPTSGGSPLGDALDDLLGDAVVYEAGAKPIDSEPFRDFEPTDAVTAAARPEERISPLYWAAAVVWSLVGGIGGWFLLRTSSPRQAKAVLVVGVVSFVVLVTVIGVALSLQHTFNPSDVYIKVP